MKQLAKSLFSEQPFPAEKGEGVAHVDAKTFGRARTTFMARGFMTIPALRTGKAKGMGEPIDVEWLQQHHSSVNTVMVRFKGNWPEAWGEDVKLPVPFETCTVAQLKAAIAAHFHWPDSLVPCPQCGTMTLNRKHFPSTYRDARCSACWFEDFNAAQTKLAAKEAKKAAAKDAKMKAAGYTHKLVAWVHAGGDDYMIEGYSQVELTTAKIHAMLKRRHSRVLTDWRQTPL